MTYECATDHHADCPESKLDRYECSCPCHLKVGGRQKSRRKKAQTDRVG